MVRECTLFDKPIDKLIEYLHVRDKHIHRSRSIYIFFKMSDLDGNFVMIQHHKCL